MTNSIDFYKRIFLHVISSRIIVPWPNIAHFGQKAYILVFVYLLSLSWLLTLQDIQNMFHNDQPVSPLLFIIVMEALSREFTVSFPWELLYADDLAILSDSLVDLKNRLAAWKTSLESHGLRVNVGKTKILISSTEHTKISARNPKYPCGVCTFGVGVNSIFCNSCDLWVHNKCSGITDHLTDNRSFVCRKCSGEIASAAIASFKEVNNGNNSFHVKSTFKYLDDTIGQCGGCSDTVSTRIVSSWKAFRECLPILTNCASEQNLDGMSSTCV